MPGGSPRHQDVGRIVNSVRQIQRVLDRYSKRLNQNFRITGQQLGLLRVAHRYPSITLGGLSGRMYLHISTVSGIADRLELRGYLKRERNPDDRRVVHLRLTPKGKRIIAQAPPSGFGLMVRNLEKLPAAELCRISRAMQRLEGLMRPHPRPGQDETGSDPEFSE